MIRKGLHNLDYFMDSHLGFHGVIFGQELIIILGNQTKRPLLFRLDLDWLISKDAELENTLKNIGYINDPELEWTLPLHVNTQNLENGLIEQVKNASEKPIDKFSSTNSVRRA